ncbi:hypothetical protein BH23ACT2_BH23ACT2_06360 [soil metagenome]
MKPVPAQEVTPTAVVHLYGERACKTCVPAAPSPKTRRTAKRVLYYHGTNATLPVGTTITNEHAAQHFPGAVRNNRVWATRMVSLAAAYGDNVYLGEIAHIIDIEENGWPPGGSEGIDLEQSWAHGPSFQAVLDRIRQGSHATRKTAGVAPSTGG